MTLHSYSCKTAFDKGAKSSALTLGIMSQKGLGTKRDFEAAIKYFQIVHKDEDKYSKYTKELLDQAIRQDKIYKLLFVKPIERMKEVSFIEYVIAILLSLIGIRIAIKSKKEKLPIYTTKGFNLIKDLSSNIDAMEILYKSERISNLTVTKLAFWNAGRETINGDDIVKSWGRNIANRPGVRFIKPTSPCNFWKSLPSSYASFLQSFLLQTPPHL